MKMVGLFRLFNTTNIFQKRFLSNVSFSKTLNLPKSSFPMKHSRNIELEIENKTNFAELYRNELTGTSGSYILHDGPPYANGDVHFGHAVNKILKDIIVKRKTLENNHVHYVPGWDCHGLPIELKAISEDEYFKITPEEIRKRARELALNAIDQQRSSFEQWSLSADFHSPYLTFESHYISNQLTAFYELYKRGLIFRDYLPVYYSPSTGTALAEAELQYNNQHISSTAYVKYPLVRDDNFCNLFSNLSGNIHALIWTTTPWTLLANEAISVGESLTYSLIKFSGQNEDMFIVAKDLVPSLKETFKSEIEILETFPGSHLVGLKYFDPVRKRKNSYSERPIVSSQHVTLSKGGTGLVHLAPNHGFDDYKIFQTKHNDLSYRRDSIVDQDGKLMDKDLMNSPVDIINNDQASKYVIENIFKEQIVLTTEHEHSYPYDWRSNKPVIIKPSSQWFLRMDSLRDKCLKELSKVQLIPEKMRKEFVYHLQNRPNWCLSRQRKWGVPIPCFYSKKNDPNCMKPILNDESFNMIIHKLKSDGNCDFWWRDNEKPENFSPDKIKPIEEEWIKSTDILDIWFDSGVSWLTVLGKNTVADLYLEGVDQLRGWFQSSLITSVALRGYAPYKSVMIHGFSLDKDGKKMSKSLGNVIKPMDIVNHEYSNKNSKTKKHSKSLQNGCGVDGLRLWIAKNACTHSDCYVNLDEFYGETLTTINRIRNSLRFILAYLDDNHQGNIIQDKNDFQNVKLIDKYILYKIWKFNQNCDKLYSQYGISDVVEAILKHVLFEISTFYFTRVKDRLYCDPITSLNYRSAITVLHYAYHTIGYQLSSIIPHVIMEANLDVKFRLDQILNCKHFQNEQQILDCFFPKQFNNHQDFEEIMKFLLRIADSEISSLQLSENSLQFGGIIESFPSEMISKFVQEIPQSDLKELFQLAHVETVDSIQPDIEIIRDDNVTSIKDTEFQESFDDTTEKHEVIDDKTEKIKRLKLYKVSLLKCDRCRLYNISNIIKNENDNKKSNLCERCSNV